ncbi:membrane-associated protein [Candidatus Vecturithrix granuli]|uniref:Membrane-associated protein n=1 Tax=Vecturithrix granuli TaxID=1499967 RepID=A0A081C3Z7_VECG1|nr:membrane-associated protein [Candidatus Vecturithrix granuli]
MYNDNSKKQELTKIWDQMWNWNIYAEENLRKFKNKDKLKILRKMGLSFLPRQKLLDGGCGDGRTLITFIQEFQIIGYGLDISTEALIKAKKNYIKEGYNIYLQQGDIRDLPYENDSFDGVLSFGVIEHFLDFKKAIKEQFRVLKPHGKVVFIQPHKYSFGPLYRKFRQWQGKWMCGFQFELSGKQLGQYMIECGFNKYIYHVEGPYKDMPYIYFQDHFMRFFWKGWGHYLYLIAEK